MPAPPYFASTRDYVARIGDVDTWMPLVGEVLDRHGLAVTTASMVAGRNATYPTFLVGDVVVKFFGRIARWDLGHRAECEALERVAAAPDILAPRLLHVGRLFEGDEAPWPYVVMTRLPGIGARDARLTRREWHALAAELGHCVRRLHALDPGDLPGRQAWGPLDHVAAAARSSLPEHLVAQVEAYLARYEGGDRAFVHGDLVAQHVLVEAGRLSGVVDWGDALATDPHYELIQVHRDLFACDRSLLEAFLEASAWSREDDLARRALAFALHRQAVGCAQHRTIDVFEPIAARYALAAIRTLDELAERVFAGP